MASSKTNEVIRVLDSVDRPMLRSKKFVVALVGQISWKLLIFYMVLTDQSSSVLLAAITAAGTVETTFLGLQAWHDRYVKPAQLNSLKRTSTRPPPRRAAKDTHTEPIP